MTTAFAPAPTAGTPTLDTATLIQWGFAVELDGIDAHEDRARILVDAAIARRIRPVLVGILADPREPSVARTRAFGKLALALVD